MKIHVNTGGIAQTNSFLVADEAARQAVIFDAPNDTTAALLDLADKEGWDIVGLWLTHGHFDHIADHPIVTRRFPKAKIVIHRLDEPKLTGLDQINRMFGLPFDIPARPADVLVDDGTALELGSTRWQVIHTPGHAAGHVCYYCQAENLLVGGDLIIGGAVGRTDLPDSSMRQLRDSVRKVMKLPAHTKLLPGHGDVTTLDHEQQTNPYVQQLLEEQGG